MTIFQEKFVDADGFCVRYLEAGSGPPLVHIHSAGGLRINAAHELLAESYRVIAVEVPGYAAGAPNQRSQSIIELGATMMRVAHAIGLERFNLWGTSFGGALAFWTACTEHPERQPMAPPLDPALRDQRRSLLARLEPFSGEDTERRMAELDVSTLAIFGTRDRLTPPELGRIYAERMPRCQLVLLYDAGHDSAGERPEAFADLVADFLRRREAFIVAEKSALLHP